VWEYKKKRRVEKETEKVGNGDPKAEHQQRQENSKRSLEKKGGNESQGEKKKEKKKTRKGVSPGKICGKGGNGRKAPNLKEKREVQRKSEEAGGGISKRCKKEPGGRKKEESAYSTLEAKELKEEKHDGNAMVFIKRACRTLRGKRAGKRGGERGRGTILLGNTGVEKRYGGNDIRKKMKGSGQLLKTVKFCGGKKFRISAVLGKGREGGGGKERRGEVGGPGGRLGRCFGEPQRRKHMPERFIFQGFLPSF